MNTDNLPNEQKPISDTELIDWFEANCQDWRYTVKDPQRGDYQNHAKVAAFRAMVAADIRSAARFEAKANTENTTSPAPRTMRDLVHARGCTPMGEYRCQIPMPIDGRLCGIDYCIADIVAALNAANIRTVMSCCGHGDESIARIDLEDGRTLFVRGHSPVAPASVPSVSSVGQPSDRR